MYCNFYTDPEPCEREGTLEKGKKYFGVQKKCYILNSTLHLLSSEKTSKEKKG